MDATALTLLLIELAPGETVDSIRERTGCDFAVAEPLASEVPA